VIPATPETPYKLRLHKKYIGPFINNELALYAYKTKAGMASDALSRLVSDSYRESILYTVKSGETVASIAKKFNMTTAELRSLNGLKKNYVKPKKKILVYVNNGKTKKASDVLASSYVPQTATKDSLARATQGNSLSETDTLASSTSEPASESTSPKTTIHTVKSGETLSLISRKYNCSVSDLVKWNNLSNQNIKVGQKLKITSSPETIATAEKTGAGKSKPTSTSSSRYFYYTIKSGDNLWEIADKYDCTVSQLKSLNKLKNNSRLRPGQKIKVPK
jgi:LysM repeat protein